VLALHHSAAGLEKTEEYATAVKIRSDILAVQKDLRAAIAKKDVEVRC